MASVYVDSQFLIGVCSVSHDILMDVAIVIHALQPFSHGDVFFCLFVFL